MIVMTMTIITVILIIILMIKWNNNNWSDDDYEDYNTCGSNCNDNYYINQILFYSIQFDLIESNLINLI